MKSISSKVLYALLLVIVPLFIVITFSSYQLVKSSESDQWVNTQQTIENQLNVILQEPVYSYDRPLIQSIIDSFVADGNIAFIEVLDQRGKSLGKTKASFDNDGQKATLALKWSDGESIGSSLIIFSSKLTDERLETATFNTVGTLLAAFILIIVVIMLILKKVVKEPLNKVSQLLDDIAHGGGDLTKRIDHEAEDEIGRLVKGFNFFVAEVQTIIKELAITALGIKDVSSKVKSAGNKSQQESKGQLELTESALENLNQLHSATEDITVNANNTADNTTESRGLSSESSESMSSNLVQIDKLVDSLEEASTIVNKVNSSSENITSVLDVIKSIAEQTNLLALNAAIEAARAGESGRGFSVVADEVRALASKTHQSTAEIEKIIEALQLQVSDSVKATNASKNMAGEIIISSRETHKKVTGIGEKMDSIADMTNMIASASEEQSMVTSGVRESMQHIHQGAQELSTQSEKLKQTIVHLSELEENLASKIGQFKYN